MSQVESLPPGASASAPGEGDFARDLQARLRPGERFSDRPEELAELFRFTFFSDPRSQALRGFLHSTLLQATVQHAREHCAFYKDPVYQEWAPPAPGDPPDLSHWPIIRRQDVIDRFDDFLADDVSLAFVCHTSGSTGPALSIYKSHQEVGFLQRYYDRFFAPAARALPELPLILSFPNLYHGVAVPLPNPGKVFVSGVTDDTLIQDALKVLQGSYKIPGYASKIRIISGLSFHVQLFTSFVIEQGLDPAAFGVQSLNLAGGYVSRHVRRFIGEAWKAAVFDRYSLTEVIGGASRCFHCGAFHLDPMLVPEVVDEDTGAVLSEGVGNLVLTPLYPFVQMQPLIRYDTGDLVRRLHIPCPEAGFQFEFLGKRKNCFGRSRNRRREWLVFSADLFEIMNEIPDVRVYEWFSNVRVVQDRTVGARQLYRLTSRENDAGRTDLDLAIELRYAPHTFRDRLQELESRITAGLRAARTDLARALDEGSAALHIRFTGPGGLGDYSPIKV